MDRLVADKEKSPADDMLSQVGEEERRWQNSQLNRRPSLLLAPVPCPSLCR